MVVEELEEEVGFFLFVAHDVASDYCRIINLIALKEGTTGTHTAG